MLGSIALGVAIVAIVVIVVYLATHHKVPATVAGADLANTVGAAVSSSWEALQRDLPSIVSAELAQAKTDLAAARQEAAQLGAQLAAQAKAHEAALAAVAARVVATITGSPELPPSPVAPAVAAAQAEDAAAVRSLATEISPAQ